jgi:hypothetical protein
MNNDFRQADQQETTFARRTAVAIMCALAVGVLAIAMSTDNSAGLVQEATAAGQADDDFRAGYFPAQFPTPQGAPEAHIEAF